MNSWPDRQLFTINCIFFSTQNLDWQFHHRLTTLLTNLVMQQFHNDDEKMITKNSRFFVMNPNFNL